MAAAPPSTQRADGELQQTLSLLHESRANALSQLHHSQARARSDEREQMTELMGELRQWKRQNEARMSELQRGGARGAYIDALSTPVPKPPLYPPQPYERPAVTAAAVGHPHIEQPHRPTTRAAPPTAYPAGAIAVATCAASTPEAVQAASRTTADSFAPSSANRPSPASSWNSVGLRSSSSARAGGRSAAASSSHGVVRPNALVLSPRAPTSAAASNVPRGERSLRELRSGGRKGATVPPSFEFCL